MTKEETEKLLLSYPELLKEYRAKPNQLFKDTKDMVRILDEYKDLIRLAIQGRPVALNTVPPSDRRLLTHLIRRPEHLQKVLPPATYGAIMAEDTPRQGAAYNPFQTKPTPYKT